MCATDVMNKKNSSVPALITDALKIIAQRLESENVTWVVIASCALALHGLAIEPEDIDIMTDDKGLLIINKALQDYCLSLSENNPSSFFDSTMSTFRINDCPIEVMSNFNIKSRVDGVWYNVQYLLKHRTMITVADVAIPVLPVEQLLELYKLMDRKKDKIKIEKIECALSA